MAAFAESNWHQLDYWAIVAGRGLATVRMEEQERALAWLRENGYGVNTIDCTGGLAGVIEGVNAIFRWERQFGYELSMDRRSLDAVNDGFEFEVAATGGRVLELVRPDIAWKEDPDWMRGLIEIASDHSLFQLSLGQRFFALLVLPADSYLIGEKLDLGSVPHWFTRW